MTCFQPIDCYLPMGFDSEGKRHLIFSPKKIYQFKVSTIHKLEKYGIFQPLKNENFDIYSETARFPDVYINHDIPDEPDGMLLQVPCGKCDGCKLDYSRRWATRAINEAKLFDEYRNCSFLSLTFNEENLRSTTLGYSVDKAFFKSWVKRLRYAVQSEYGVTFRHMSCGEYGAKRSRPHYHMLIFGFNFPDKYVFKVERKYGTLITYYRSPFLEKLWHLPGRTDSAGFSMIGNVNFETCAYVARYVTKKCHNKDVYGDKQPEFLNVSRMPGLGYEYCANRLDTIFGTGHLVLPSGHKTPIPRYYESICEKLNPELYYNYKYEKFQKMRKEMLRRFSENSNPDSARFETLKELTELRLDRLCRNYELG